MGTLVETHIGFIKINENTGCYEEMEVWRYNYPDKGSSYGVSIRNGDWVVWVNGQDIEETIVAAEKEFIRLANES